MTPLGKPRRWTDLPLRVAGALSRRLRGWRDSSRDAESVFTEIYRNNIWGGEQGSICSGGGSHDADVAEAYLQMMRSQAEIHSYGEATFVDLGCGDMAIGKSLIPLCREFIGVDVVRFVIDRHREEFGGENVRFVHADMTNEDLPDGDVCLIRQVFQHLSNRQIAAVLPKLCKYRHVYLTEHLPTGEGWMPNRDKPHGAGIRLSVGSGVDITAQPFGIAAEKVRHVLDVAGNDSGVGGDAGIIRTVLYTTGGESSA
jgi:hypothetical protein